MNDDKRAEVSTKFDSTTFKLFLSILLLCCCTVTACRTISRFYPKSGAFINVEVRTDESNVEEITERTVRILQNRLDSLGADGEVSKTAANRIELKIYASDNEKIGRIKEFLLEQNKFELRPVIGNSTVSSELLPIFSTKEIAVESLGGGTIPPNRKVLRYVGDRLPRERDTSSSSSDGWIVVENPALVDGLDLRDASARGDSGYSENYQVAFSLTPAGAVKLGKWTSVNIGKHLALVLNDEVKSAPVVQGVIQDQIQLSGGFSKQQAEDLAALIKSGNLPAELYALDEKHFGQ